MLHTAVAGMIHGGKVMLSSMQGIKASSSDKQLMALVLGLPNRSWVWAGSGTAKPYCHACKG